MAGEPPPSSVIAWDSRWGRSPGGSRCGLDWHNPDVRQHIAAPAGAIVQTQVVDGVFLDSWGADDRTDPDVPRLARTIRQTVGPEYLIIVNSNNLQVPNSADAIDGIHMETGIPRHRNEAPEWQQAATIMRWASTAVLPPRIVAFETWSCTGTGQAETVLCDGKDRQRLNRMRATTTLSLALSDGYVLFGDPDPLPTSDHLHDWYPFWEKSLGQPSETGRQRPDGAYERAFERGSVVSNLPGNQPVRVSLPEPRRSAATGQTASEFTVQPVDGDLFLRLS